MTFRIHHNRFLLTALGSLGVILSVVMKNTTEQMKIPDSPFSKLGSILFFVSWMVVAYSIGMDNRGGFSPSLKALVAFSAAAGILYAVSQIKPLMKAGVPERVMRPFMYLFMVSWLLLGVSIGLGRNNTAYMLGVLGAISVILSMIYALPWQRKNCIVDGPGMPLFVIGWFLVAFGNAVY